MTHLEYSYAQLPQTFEGYRIVHISDLHVDSFDRPGHLEKLLQMINDQGPEVGGMPQAVNSYIDTNDLSKVDAVKRNIT